MPKKDFGTGESIISETGNWNIASDFSREMIAKPLIACNYYRDIAKFGYEQIAEELYNWQVPNEVVKFKGLTRLIEELIKVCENAKFAMKKQGTKETLKKIKERLEIIRDAILPSLAEKN